jgi:hypothetical protein
VTPISPCLSRPTRTRKRSSRRRSAGYEVGAIVEQEAVGRLATVRLTWRAERHAPVIDLLFASSGIEAEVVETAEIVEILPGLPIPVARIDFEQLVLSS